MKRTLNRREQFELLAKLVTGNVPGRAIDWQSERMWQQLVPLAELHRVTALLPGALRKLDVFDRLPPQLAEFLLTVHALNTERNQAVQRQCEALLSCLANAGIRAVPLKGLAYQMKGLYADDPGGRMTIDIDVLVPSQDAAQAQASLIAAGYCQVADYPVSRTDHHNYPRLISGPGRDEPASIEVHFRLGRDATDAVLPAHGVLKGTVQTTVSGNCFEIPNTVDLLDHAVMHSAIAHMHAVRRTVRLRDVCDIYRLWRCAQSEGACMADLKIARHATASRYFGACLLLHGERLEVLGATGGKSARSFLEQVLVRQHISERAQLETSLVSNGALLLRNPSKLLSKLLHRRIYRSALSVAKSRTV